MSYYKVPQDVEAEDKLLGPFSFRQFVYLMIVAGLSAVAWGLSRVFIGLALIPAPLIIFFAALALPLRKDQPTETYLAALLNYLIRPRKRVWDPDGIDHTIEILAPKTMEVPMTKAIYGQQAVEQLGYLAQVIDTSGWAAVNPSLANIPQSATLSGDVLAEADTAPDMLGSYDSVSQNIDRMIDKNSSLSKDQLVNKFKQEAAFSTGNLQKNTASQLVHSVQFEKAYVQPTNPDIIKLANDEALNIETIAKQANRLTSSQDDGVSASLR